MVQVSLNYWAILVAAIVNIVLGFLWYSPLLFGKPWMRLMNIDKKKMNESKKKGMTKNYIVMIISTLVMTYILAHFVSYIRTLNFSILSAPATFGFIFSQAFQLAFWIWLGFVATVMLGSILWEGKPVKLYLINAFYYLVSFILMAVILFAWP